MKLIKKSVVRIWRLYGGEEEGRGEEQLLVSNSKDRLGGRNQEDMWPGRYSRYSLPQLSEFLNDITKPVTDNVTYAARYAKQTPH